MNQHREQILELRAKGRSYKEIVDELGCSKSTVAYHCGEGQKAKNEHRSLKNRTTNLLSKKIHFYKTRSPKDRGTRLAFTDQSKKALHNRLYKYKRRQGEPMKEKFGVKEFFEVYGDVTNCYLTGRPIDINDPTTYTFDHKVPTTRNGDNSLENLGICCPEVNDAKGALLPEEFVALCRDVLEHHGYEVRKKTGELGIEPKSSG